MTRRTTRELRWAQIAINYIMGAAPPTPPQPNQYFLPQYGGNVLVDRPSRKVYKTVTVHPDEIPQFTSMVRARMTLHHPNFSPISDLQEESVSASGICSSGPTSYVVSCQLYAYSLFNEIQNCCRQRRPIAERQICRIFSEVVECLQYLHAMGTHHGDIKVGSIFMDKQRKVKLVDSFFLKHGKTSYEVILEDPRSMSILAPEQLDQLRLKVFDKLGDISRREMFMVGLSMIETTTIQQAMRCYDLEKLQIRQQFFLHMMEQIQSCGYSYALSNLIMDCVHKDPLHRPSHTRFLQRIATIRAATRPPPSSLTVS